MMRMSDAEWAYIKRMAAEQGVTLKATGVNLNQRFGYAMDLILVEAERQADANRVAKP